MHILVAVFVCKCYMYISNMLSQLVWELHVVFGPISRDEKWLHWHAWWFIIIIFFFFRLATWRRRFAHTAVRHTHTKPPPSNQNNNKKQWTKLKFNSRQESSTVSLSTSTSQNKVKLCCWCKVILNFSFNKMIAKSFSVIVVWLFLLLILFSLVYVQILWGTRLNIRKKSTTAAKNEMHFAPEKEVQRRNKPVQFAASSFSSTWWMLWAE